MQTVVTEGRNAAPYITSIRFRREEFRSCINGRGTLRGRPGAATGGLRLNSLAPGTYVLQVKVKGGDATQLIDFEVVP
jgi:hypothetical protein